MTVKLEIKSINDLGRQKANILNTTDQVVLRFKHSIFNFDEMEEHFLAEQVV